MSCAYCGERQAIALDLGYPACAHCLALETPSEVALIAAAIVDRAVMRGLAVN